MNRGTQNAQMQGGQGVPGQEWPSIVLVEGQPMPGYNGLTAV